MDVTVAAPDADPDGAPARPDRRASAAAGHRGARHPRDHRRPTPRRSSARRASRRLLLEDGTRLPADLVVMAVGIRPNAQLAKDAGLDVNRGIVVDATMRTSDPDIFAVGECAEAHGQVFGLVAPLYDMASVIAAQLAGDATADVQAERRCDQAQGHRHQPVLGRRLRRCQGPRGDRAARRRARRLQAARAQGRQAHRRRDVRRHQRRRLVLRPR